MTDEERQQIEPTEEEPQVYTVKKDVNGWRFDRRAFLAVAGAAAATAAVGTAGCGSPPESVQESTAVADERATATPSPSLPPSDTPAPASTPTPAETPTPTTTPTVVHTPASTMPMAQLVEDVAIQEGTVMIPGQPFTRTWRFRNVGAVPWGQGVKLVFVEGQKEGFESKRMDGPDAVDVPNVAPGMNVDVSVDLVAPEELGRHRGYWRLQLGSGQWLEDILYAEIFVAGVGEVPPDEVGSTIRGSGGENRWLPCGEPIPTGWICTCNCVSVPSPCTCDSVCDCDTVHYWHPN